MKRVKDDFWVGYLNNSLDAVIDELMQLQAIGLEKGWTDLQFRIDPSGEFCLQGRRPETDKERTTRLKLLAKSREQKAKKRAQKEERERKTFERLKKKYG